MATTQLIKQTVAVKKVITKAESKFGKASIIVPLNGKDEFLGINDGVDENAFEAGNSYEVEISVAKSGKRYVNKIVGATESAAPVKAPTKVPANTASHTASAPVSHGLDREVRITLMNVGNIAGVLSTGDADAFVKNFDLVKAKYEKEGIL